MTWASRFPSLGKFSPFGRPAQSGSSQVSDADFSYITSDDLKNQGADAGSDPRDTDVLIFKNKRTSYPVHFPAFSIAKDELTIGAVREQAAKKIGTDPRRLKMLYKGKNLKDDDRLCRAEGLKSNAEILCTVGDAPAESPESSDSEDDGVPLDANAAESEAPKRKRNRNRNKKKKGKKTSGSGADTPVTSDTLPVPPAETSRAPTPKPAPTPLTTMEKLDALNSKLQALIPQCVQLQVSPPSDPAKRDFEHKRLSETILAQILIKLDGVEVEGDPDARARRKELVKEAQRVLNGLDDAMK